MRINRRLFLLSLFLLSSSIPTMAGMLTGSVSFDSATQLYTYSYVVDNRLGAARIDTIDIVVNSHDMHLSFAPVSTTSPMNFIFDGVSAGCGAPFGNPCETVWSWFDNGPPGVPVGSVISGFSFVTRVAPSTNNYTNYGLFALTLGNSLVESGHIVAPEQTPEASTVVFVASGLALLAFRRRFQSVIGWG